MKYEADFGLLDQLPVGVCVVDSDLRVVQWNRRLHDWTGQPSDAVVGRPIAEVAPRLGETRYARRLRSVLAGGPPVILSAQLHGHVIRCPSPSGADRIQTTTLMLLPASAERGNRAIVIVEDVTDLVERIRAHEQARELLHAELEVRARAQAQLRAMTDALRDSNRQLDEFASIVAHDLKAPLRHIMSYARMATDHYGHELGEQPASFLDKIVQSAERMGRLISGVLAYSRLTMAERRPVRCQLQALVHEVVAELQPDLAFLSGTVNIQLRGAFVLGDDTQLKQMFRNLFSNSMKFRHPHRPLVIDLDVQAATAESGTWLELSVRDNGIGFQPRYSREIFGMCRRLHSDREYEGSGVGLAIVERVVERHGGTVVALGKPGEGAEFTVRLPGALTDGCADFTAPSDAASA